MTHPSPLQGGDSTFFYFVNFFRVYSIIRHQYDLEKVLKTIEVWIDKRVK